MIQRKIITSKLRVYGYVANVLNVKYRSLHSVNHIRSEYKDWNIL